MIRLIVFIIVVLATVFAFWLGGFDFTERGPTAVVCYLAALFIGLFAVSNPGSYPGEK